MDDYTHFTVVYLVESKDEVISNFWEYFAMASGHFEKDKMCTFLLVLGNIVGTMV